MHFLKKFRLHLVAVLAFAFLATLVLNPNPFGNNPDAVGDESFFLTSSLSSIQKITLPGWEFSRSGSFYGGIQAYLDFFILLPILAIIWAASGSMLAAKLYIANNSGHILHALRLLNGLIFLLTIAWFAYIYFKKRLPKVVAFKMILLLLLLMGNSLFVGVLHTAKVWALFSIMEIIIGLVFILQATVFQQEQRFFLDKQKYIGALIWLSIFIVIQNVVGVSNILWIVYALFLGHFTIVDLLNYLKKKIFLILGFFGLQLSFVYRSYLMFFEKNSILKFTDVTGTSLRTTQGAIDWIFRLWRPIEISLRSQPLLIVYFVLLLVLLFKFVKQKNINKLYFVAVVHPVLIFLMRHALFGLSSFPRYILPLTVALTLSIVAILDWKMTGIKMLSCLAVLAMLVISIQTYRLYWQPSSEQIMNNELANHFNSSSIALIIDGSAGRLNLPINKESLENLNNEKKSMERFKFLLQHADKVNDLVPFKSTVVIADPEHPVETLATQLKKENKQIWVISSSCQTKCSSATYCVNEQACHTNFAPAQEVTTWADYLSATELGSIYSLKKID